MVVCEKLLNVPNACVGGGSVKALMVDSVSAVLSSLLGGKQNEGICLQYCIIRTIMFLVYWIRCHSAAALHQVCLCLIQVAGELKDDRQRLSTLLYWYKPFYFLLQVTRSVTTFIQLALVWLNMNWNKFWYCEILHWRWQTMWPEMGMDIWRLDWDSHGVMCRAHVCSCREWRMQRRHPYGPQLWPNHHDRWVLGKLSRFSKKPNKVFTSVELMTWDITFIYGCCFLIIFRLVIW